MSDPGHVDHKVRFLLCWLTGLLGILLYTLVDADRSRAQQSEGQLSDQASAPVTLPGHPISPGSAKLSEHNIQWLRTQKPQVQMEFLLEAAINHDQGATDFIAEHVTAWHGKLESTQRWQDLEQTALYSNDLRVRAAAIEINLAVNNLAKSDATVAALIESAEKQAQSRPWSAWELGMLASRGIEPEQVHEQLATWAHDKDQQTRFWAVEGLAHLGTDETIKDFLDVLRNDPDMRVRERAGCSLAKSGMLSREQRMKAAPGLLELTDDPALNATTRAWVFQALREITDEHLPSEAATWRNWYSANGQKKIEQFRHQPPWALLGNS